MPKATSAKLEIQTESDVKIPPNMARAGWDIDPDILRKFAQHFGITLPIRVRFSTGNSAFGRQSTRKRQGITFHQICLEQNQPESEARLTMLHELRHAMQTENFIRNHPDETPMQCRNRFAKDYINRRQYYEDDAENFAYKQRDKWGAIIY